MPHCRTLEEMRALRRPCRDEAPACPPPPAAPPAYYPPPGYLLPAAHHAVLPAHPAPAYLLPAAAHPPSGCGAPAVAVVAPPAAAVLLVDAADAACAHFPHVCARTRLLHDWCRACTHRRLFPECAPAARAGCCPRDC